MTSIHHSIASQNQLDPLRSYVSPLASRNASPEMQAVWSPQNKHTTWRRLWIALAEAEMELGLEISPEQIAELNANVENIDFRAVAEYEAETQHDVMAHIRAFADVAPAAGPIWAGQATNASVARTVARNGAAQLLFTDWLSVSPHGDEATPSAPGVSQAEEHTASLHRRPTSLCVRRARLPGRAGSEYHVDPRG